MVLFSPRGSLPNLISMYTFITPMGSLPRFTIYLHPHLLELDMSFMMFLDIDIDLSSWYRQWTCSLKEGYLVRLIDHYHYRHLPIELTHTL